MPKYIECQMSRLKSREMVMSTNGFSVVTSGK